MARSPSLAFALATVLGLSACAGQKPQTFDPNSTEGSKPVSVSKEGTAASSPTFLGVVWDGVSNISRNLNLFRNPDLDQEDMGSQIVDNTIAGMSKIYPELSQQQFDRIRQEVNADESVQSSKAIMNFASQAIDNAALFGPAGLSVSNGIDGVFGIAYAVSGDFNKFVLRNPDAKNGSKVAAFFIDTAKNVFYFVPNVLGDFADLGKNTFSYFQRTEEEVKIPEVASTQASAPSVSKTKESPANEPALPQSRPNSRHGLSEVKVLSAERRIIQEASAAKPTASGKNSPRTLNM